MSDRKNMSHQPEWDDLKTMWQDSTPVDMEKLARNARLVWWRMRLIALVEILFCIVGAAVFLYAIVEQQSLARVVFGVFGVCFCVGGGYACFWSRRGAWGHAEDDALSLVRLQIKRARAGIRYVKLNCWMGVASIAILPLAFWVMNDGTRNVGPDHMKEVHITLAVAGLAIIASVVALWPYYRKKKRELHELEVLEHQLSEED
ncbi:hypothetical protein [Kordiimonas aestuarii]|uniref:hypothetical protein n=1 Tax=Kordiimonas aestuarii TaxID=1005925 RepID=UPI0021D20124|nr:hypothetical protein [Kordiimonas aestuarii]